MANNHTTTEVTKAQPTNFGKLGSVAQVLVHLDAAIDGPGIVQDPSNRIMGGARSSAHATEQIAAITAAGGLIAGHTLLENGKSR